MEYHIARVNYHYQRLLEIKRGIPLQGGGNVEFEAYVFFEVCYHLKDWIRYDPRYVLADHDVHLYIKDSIPLRICSDLCNRFKHRILDKPKDALGPLRFQSLIAVGPAGAFGALGRLNVLTSRGDRCVFSIADDCMTEWDKYFASHPELIDESKVKLCTPKN